MEMFQYDFMQRAFLAAICIACIAPILGLLLILRKQSLLADTLSHVSLSGVALGLLIGVSPTVTTIVVVMIAALIMEYLSRVYKSYSEISVAILMSTGLAVALILMSLRKNAAGIKVEQYLFGSLVTVSSEQVSILIGLVIFIGGLYILFRKPLYVLLFDEDTAFTAGLPVRLMSLLINIVTGVTISVMMPIAGALLVASILILPTAISMRFSNSFTSVILWAMCIGFLGMVGGLYASYEYSTPPGATITLIFVTVLVFVNVIIFVKKWYQQQKAKV
ncbi:iron chelate uptake ABC transporter family permease subunit [Granulicatella sp. zg-ZJ]|uniref:metal ABC transporter permease n=1 Tax=unclassified Granulicatella TaxID=2630493 RepID=UPI0013C03277|nr:MULTISPECIES: metal ABC transporter permease [unclassified Granulicatella]MBS4750292.1 metal ABC transporter permease [Carnobacteriaceae bacterium zg-ZUI78]NEW63378.1 iron chelate uptake ABC transporter family permease subunit [Granulicatella sp. zg-ZJ]NEW66569.1 iron chelate uptake ABC transporter family permease subunit [Granulicatella sp. zg-84]QMI85771.1 metal ABC transporter permease [Carnobacteriaceae bacterium zg-84]